MMTGRRRNELNSLTDCLIYAGLVGAGFAWLEDILYIGGGDTVGESLLTAAMRLIMAPFAHPLFTTMFGIGVYFAIQRRIRRQGASSRSVTRGPSSCTGCGTARRWSGAGTYFGVYLLWMVPIFVLVIGSGSGRRREQRVVAGKLPGMVAAGLVTPNEATWLGSIRNRKLAIGRGGADQRQTRRRSGEGSPPKSSNSRSCGTASTVVSATSEWPRCSNEEAQGVLRGAGRRTRAAGTGRIPGALVRGHTMRGWGRSPQYRSRS